VHEVMDVAQRLVSTAKQLNQVLEQLGEELTMEDRVNLAELNAEFVQQVRETDERAKKVAEDLHQYLLRKGVEPRAANDRRVAARDRRWRP
jgi:protein subunit release factor A